MVCSASSYTGVRNDNMDWSNWSGRSRKHVASWFTPAPAGATTPGVPIPPPEGLRQLVKVAKDATDAHVSLHAIGSGWAFDDQAVGDQWTIDISGLRSRLMGTVGPAIVPDGPQSPPAIGPGLTNDWRQKQADRNGRRKLVHVEAGIKLWQLVQMLDAVGLALPTLGGSNGQALAGVINTSVHGGDWNEPAFPGVVRAIHLVTDGGRELWIEPTSAPITQDDRLKPTLACPDLEVVRSDEVFNGALVGLGRFGIVYSYVIEVRPQFWVAELATRPDRNAVFAALRAGANSPTNPFAPLLSLLAQDPGPSTFGESRLGTAPSFFQLVLSTRNPPGIWVQRRWETGNRTDMNIGTATPQVSGDCVASLLTLLLALNPSGSVTNPVNPDLDVHVNAAINDVMGPAATTGRRGKHAWITAGPPTGVFPDYRGVSVEVMFDAGNPAYVDFLEEVNAAGGRFRQAGWLSLRPSLATTATLAMHNVGGTHAVSIEIALLGGMLDNEAFLTFIQQRALALGGRLHWGQANNLLNPTEVGKQYGGMLESWRRSLWRVSGDSTVFSNVFTRQRGLEPLAARSQIAVTVPAADQLMVARSGALQSKSWSGSTGWTAWQDLPLGVPQGAGPLEAISEGGRAHLYFVGGDGGIYFRSRQPNGQWASVWWYVTPANNEKPWQGVAGGAVHAVSSSPGGVHVFYANASGSVIAVRGETTGGSSRWRNRTHVLGGRTAPGGHVTGVSRRPGQIDLFTVGPDRTVYTAAWNSTDAWRGWWSIPGVSAPAGSPVTAVSRRGDFLDIFVSDDAGRIMTSAWQPGHTWSNWSHVQGGLTAPGGWVTAASRSTDLLDVFVVGTDSLVYSAAWEPAHGWNGWWPLNGAKGWRPGSAVPVACRSANMLDIFMVDSSNNLQTLAWAPGSSWGGPWPI